MEPLAIPDLPPDLPAVNQAGVLVRRLSEAGMAVIAAVEAIHLTVVSGRILQDANSLVRFASDRNRVLDSPGVDDACHALCEAIDRLTASRGIIMAVAAAAEHLADQGGINMGSLQVCVNRAAWDDMVASVQVMREARQRTINSGAVGLADTPAAEDRR